MGERVLGCDTSHWADTLNFETMYNAGAKFWITKATDAYVSFPLQYEDSKFMEFSEAAIKHGKLLTGCFHWLQASVDPKAAADFYLERYNRFAFDFPPVLDFEEQGVFKTGLFSDYAWRAQVWLERVNEKTGRLPILYTGQWYTTHFKPEHIAWMAKYPLWVADYTWKSNVLYDRPTYMPKPWTKQTIWQFSADGNGRGKEFGMVKGDIDLNWYEGNLDELKAFIGANDNPPVDPPIEPPVPPSVGVIRFEVLTDTLNVRSGPGTNYPVVGRLSKGAVVEAQDFGGSSCWIKTSVGWCAVEYQSTRYAKLKK